MKAHPINHDTDGAVASKAHTMILLFAILALALGAGISSPISEWPSTLSGQNARLLLYIRMLILQMLWVGYVWFGMRRSTASLRTLIDDSRWTARRWLWYLAIGSVGWVTYLAIGSGLARLLHPSHEALQGLQAMLPKSAVERVLWVGFAFAAGICEEIVYRGYLLRQFRSWTGRPGIGIVLQALCYTLVHLALPVQMLAGVAVLGLLLGGMAAWQKSLVPGMILHMGVGLTAMVG